MSKGNTGTDASEKVDLAVFKEVYEREVNEYIIKRRKELASDGKSGVDNDFHDKLQDQVNEDIKSNNTKKDKLEKKRESITEEEFDKKKDELRGLEPEVDYNLVGLCFSGGGIRSATFNLGLVQAMAKRGIFKIFDYLSTISGGSYIGACLSNLLSLPDTKTYGDKFPFSFKRDKGDNEEKKVIQHLRDHSNFLTPHVGIFSRDTWYMIAVILRGMFLNFIILFSFFTAILSGFMLGQYYLYWKGNEPWVGLDKWHNWEGWWPYTAHYFPILITVGFLIATIIFFPIIIWVPQFIMRVGGSGKCIFTHSFRKWYGNIQLVSLAVALFVVIIILLPFGVRFLPGYVNNIIGGITLASLFAIFKYNGNAAGKYKGLVKRLIPVVIPIFFIGLSIYIMGVWLVPKTIYCTVYCTVCSEISGLNTNIWHACEWEDMLVWSKKMWWIFYGSLGVFVIYGFFININRISYHNFYKDKITETYILKPVKSSKTEKYEGDHSKLLENLHGGGNGAPYHLINSAINLTGESDLSLRGRKADFFLFSKEYCGSKMTGYRNTGNYFDNYFDMRNIWGKDYVGQRITLGRAVTISGAAVNPQSGSMWGPSVSFLMTLMNARVGFWIPNPKKSKRHCILWPWYFIFWPWYIVYRELFSRSRHDSYLCNLADGAIIENLGIYELVKRKCKYIVAVDVGADPDMEFKDLGNVLRKVRIDLGVEINLDVEMLRKQAETDLSKWHCVADTIHYPGNEKGIIVYIKSSLTGDESEDLFHYRKQNPAFPHETTADQFFDEAQFESYRQLGYHIGQKAFEGFNVGENDPITNNKLTEEFGKLLSKWRPPVPDLSKSFLRNAEKYMELERLLKENPELAEYDLETYPELERLVEDVEELEQAKRKVQQAEGQVDRLTDEQEAVDIKHNGEGLIKDVAEDYTPYIRQITHFCNMQIQLMENVWMALEMDRYYNHPDNRGWMNLFRRWAGSETFRMVWSINKGLYGRNFKEFAEARLNLITKQDEYNIGPEVNGLEERDIKEFKEILMHNLKKKYENLKEFIEKYEDWKKILESPKKDDHKIYTMKNNIKIKGTSVLFVMGIAFLTREKKDTMKLEFIVVRDYLQRMGLGKQIFGKIINDLRTQEKEITTLCTEIYKDTPKPVNDFYYRLGFRDQRKEERRKGEELRKGEERRNEERRKGEKIILEMKIRG